jgi:Ca2+-binding RTX toxin-like protein
MLFDRSRGEILVNTGIYAYQSQAKVTVLSSGGYVVTWHTAGGSAAGVHESIRVQRFNAIGQKDGPESILNSVLPTGTSVSAPDIVALADGGYAVVWAKTVDGAREFRVRSFNADGTELTAEAAIPGSDGGGNPALAALAGGGFAVAWHESGFVHAQLYDGAGAPAGSTLVVDSGPFSTSGAPAVAGLADGRFLVSWWEGGSSDVKARLFNADGTAVGGEFLVNTGTAGTQNLPSAAALEGGGFVVAWTSSNGSAVDVHAQVFDAAGLPVGGELLVNSAIAGSQNSADVTALAGGGFLVAWTDSFTAREGGAGVSSAAIVAQAYDAAGARVGGEFQVNTTIKSDQAMPSLTALPNGEVVVVWTDYSLVGAAGWQGYGSDIRGQMFKPHAAITDIASTATGVSEVAFVGSLVGTLSSNAAVNGGVIYQIVGDSSGGAFRIDGNQLIVDRNGLLDFETATSVSLTVRATEAGGLSYDELLSVTVGNSVGELRYVPEDAFVYFDSTTPQAWSEGALVTRLSTGHYLTVVQERTGSTGVTHARVIDEAGSAIGAPMILAGPGAMGPTELVALQDGGFALAWTVHSGYLPDMQTAPREDVLMQRYDAAGSALGDAVIVNTTITGDQYNPHMAMLADGSLLVAWYDGQPSGGQQPIPSLRGQIFASSGERIGGEFFIAEPAGPDGTSMNFDVASLPGGGFLATWFPIGGSSPVYGELTLQLFDSLGNKSGAAIQVNTTTSGLQVEPSVAVLASGGFVISWTDHSGQGGDFSSGGIKAQRFDAQGAKLGGEFLVNTITNYPQAAPQVVALPTGGFVISWADYSTGTGSKESQYLNVKAQLFTETGARVGSEFQINQATQFTQISPTLAAGPSGSFIAFWGDDASGSWDYTSARIYRMVAPGTAAGDVIAGTAGMDMIDGLGGDDILDGGAGADTMRGGLGDDVFVVDNGGDTVLELDAQGIDEVRVALASFSLAGLAHVEKLTGGSADQTLTGNGLDNVINGGLGADAMAGGDGHDTYVVDSFGDTVTELDGAGADEVRTALGTRASVYVLPDFVEKLTGTSAAAQAVEGNALDNIINMGVGNDLLVLHNGGDDIAHGNNGNDFFYYGDAWTADDQAIGGIGNDTIGLIGTYNLTLNATTMIGIERMALYTGLFLPGNGPTSYNITTVDENVQGAVELFITAASLQAGETLTFDGSAETSGRFTIHGGADNDVIIGGAGNDFFLGRGGNDQLFGGGGSDGLVGGLGADQLTGGAGNDYFRYQNVAESTASTMDRILDFQTGDRIDLSSIDANSNLAGNNPFAFIGDAAFSSSAGQLRAYETGGNWFVEGDVDGDGAADLVIQVTLADPAPLGAGDFLF